jgi:4-hydroxybenzoate polyprenyltransferase
VAGLCLLLGFLLASVLPLGFSGLLVLYVAMTVPYSVVFKRHVVIDVIVLSLLYTLRIVAGGLAIGVEVSAWLLAFSAFVFLSLALAKRCSELIALAQVGQQVTHGRAYRAVDMAILRPLGVAAALAAIVVFGLFISAPETQARYETPGLLWLAACGVTYWMARMWIMTGRGEMHDDPLVYAITDRPSLLTALLLVATLLAAHSLDLAWPE